MKEMTTMSKVIFGLVTIQVLVVVTIAFVLATDIFKRWKKSRKRKKSSRVLIKKDLH